MGLVLIKNKEYIYERRKGSFIKIKYIGEIIRDEPRYEFENLDYSKGVGSNVVRIKKGSWRLKKLKKNN
jgi:hypothetical protein